MNGPPHGMSPDLGPLCVPKLTQAITTSHSGHFNQSECSPVPGPSVAGDGKWKPVASDAEVPRGMSRASSTHDAPVDLVKENRSDREAQPDFNPSREQGSRNNDPERTRGQSRSSHRSRGQSRDSKRNRSIERSSEGGRDRNRQRSPGGGRHDGRERSRSRHESRRSHRSRDVDRRRSRSRAHSRSRSPSRRNHKDRRRHHDRLDRDHDRDRRRERERMPDAESRGGGGGSSASGGGRTRKYRDDPESSPIRTFASDSDPHRPSTSDVQENCPPSEARSSRSEVQDSPFSGGRLLTNALIAAKRTD